MAGRMSGPRPLHLWGVRSDPDSPTNVRVRMPQADFRALVMDTLRRFLSKTERDTNGCWIWTGSLGRKGYGQFWYEDTMARAHRVSWLLMRGPIPDGLLVCHRCDVRACVNPDHLFLGTNDDNMSDMDAKGRRNPPRGENHGLTHLNSEQVRDIRQRVEDGELQVDLADEFDVSVTTISAIVHRRTWRE